MLGMDPAALAAEAPAGDELAGADAAMEGMAGGGADGDISEEELEQVLSMMVQSGELSEEELASILEQVGAAGGAEEAGEAMGAMEGGDMEVQASAADVQQSFLNHLANVRSGK
jgi:hypothetical protein